MKILLIAGHGASDPGATATIFGTKFREAEEAREVVSGVAKLLKDYAEVSIYLIGRNAYEDYKSGSLGTLAQFSKHDYVLEVHFNAISADAGDGKTKGVECHVATSEPGIKVEKAIVGKVAALGLTNRGVTRKNWSVIQSARNAGVSAALLEVCFIDDADDMRVYLAKKAQIAQAIANGIVEGFNLKKSEPSTGTTPPAAPTTYRIRKSWTEASSQIGAYSSLPNAKAAWKRGYFIYDASGKDVYPTEIKNIKELPFLRGKIVDVPLGAIEHIEYVPMNGTRGETMTQAARRAKWNGRSPTLICNAELFDFKTFKPSSGVVNNGVIGLLPEQYGFAFKDYVKPVFSYKNNVNAKDYIGAYPSLVIKKTVGFSCAPIGLGGKVARTFLALNQDSFAVGYIPASAGETLDTVANQLIKCGYDYAINLDGGGSTAMSAPRFTYDQGRPVRGFVAVWCVGGAVCKASKTTSPAPSSGMRQDTSARGGVCLYASCNAGSVLNVRTSASTNAPIKKTLKRGESVMWYGYHTADNQWNYVRCSDNTTGYISKKYLSKVKV